MVTFLQLTLFISFAAIGTVHCQSGPESLPTSIKNYTYANVSGCLAFFARKIELSVGEKDDQVITLDPNQMSIDSESMCSDEKSVLSLQWINPPSNLYPIKITMDFKLASNGYWGVVSESMNVNNSKFLLNLKWPSLPAIMGYKCQHATTFLTSNSTRYAKLTFTGMQVQPFSASAGRFLEATDCVGFFSIGVLSNLLISSILIGIFFYGLVMLVGIQSHDSFDDPKTKMIQLGLTTE